jgi:hypothetical protein
MIVSGRYEPVPTIATLFIVYPFSAKHISLNANIEQKRTRYVKGNVDEARRLTSRQACRLSSLQAGKLAGDVSPSIKPDGRWKKEIEERRRLHE